VPNQMREHAGKKAGQLFRAGCGGLDGACLKLESK
jgi:hypothetical protein